ncbi:thioester reductase domain-containing protein [Chitinophaga solisilvae]|uniref:thioester reductase domain-containing protein n=1 Tax=Chitinophaga solisilvae TaxID=1233460 RepID=UPI00136B71FC|nr:thioester reductase domain-containing protein [Chitinophaga solisilvae]
MHLSANTLEQKDKMFLQQVSLRLKSMLTDNPELKDLLVERHYCESLSQEAFSITLMRTACEIYADRPAMGSRSTGIETDESGLSKLTFLPAFRTITYRQLWKKITDIATGLRHLQLIGSKEIMAFLGFGSMDLFIMELACMHQAIVAAPLQPNLTADVLQELLNECQAKAVTCSFDQLEKVVDLLHQCPSVQSIVVTDFYNTDTEQLQWDKYAQRLKAVNDKMVMIPLQQVEALGAGIAPLPVVCPEDPEQLLTLIYTSGSTARPKGAMYTERAVLTQTRTALGFIRPFEGLPMVSLSCLPQCHGLGKLGVFVSIISGGLLHFTLKPDMSSLFDDLAQVRPTYLMLAPRIFEIIHQAYHLKLRQHTAPEGNGAIIAGQNDIPSEKVVAGDRLLWTVTAGAPLQEELYAFMENTMGVRVINLYGQTETGFISTDNRLIEANVIDYKLVDVPEQGYRKADSPFPRGELRVRIRGGITGYFKNPHATQSLYDEDGYLCIGDIVEERAPWHIVPIGRTTGIFKLSQGEFVNVNRLENVFHTADGPISRIFLYGKSTQPYLLAVIVPRFELLQLLQLTESRDEPKIKELISWHLARVAEKNSLQEYEIPRDFIIEWEPFTIANGLLTAAGKTAYGALKQKYQERLDNLYDRHQQLARLAAQETNGEKSLADKVRHVFAIALHLPESQLKEATGFKDTGGDSVNAALLSELLYRHCQVKVPVSFILSPSVTLSDIIRYISKSATSKDTRSFEAIHGNSPDSINADQLQPEHLFSREELSLFEQAAPYMDGKVKQVLLTGANGFLGRFIVLEALTRLPEDAKLYCIVRGKDREDATKRLLQSYAPNPHLALLMEEAIKAGYLEVMAGDLSLPRLGLDDDTWDRLCHDIDCIIHNGTLVNHLLSYEQLFAPNVAGTAALISMTLSVRKKRFSFVSTLDVMRFLPVKPRLINEEIAATAITYKVPVSNTEPGYSASKWACEVLLEHCRIRFGLPVTIFRCGLIFGHSGLQDQINIPDYFTRLLFSIIHTGIAPASFYTDPVNGFHSMLPVDFAAKAIAGITFSKLEKGYTAYHVSNTHRAGSISLDDIVRYVQAAGYSINTIAGYNTWVSTFRKKLEALPAVQQQRSSLPVIRQWEQQESPEDYKIETTRFREKIITESISDTIPDITGGMIDHYLKSMQSLGLIPSSAGGEL